MIIALNPINWSTLCSDSHLISKEKGWLDTERTFAGLSALMHSELSEAIEDYRNNYGISEIYFEKKEGTETFKIPATEFLDGKTDKELKQTLKPCGIPIELADFLIRIAQYCGTENLDLPSVHREKNRMTRRLNWGGFEESVAWAHVFISRAFAASQGVRLEGIVGVGPSITTFYQAANSVEGGLLNELANAVLVIEDFAVVHNVLNPKTPALDLGAAVMMKQKYNQSRPYRHGGKKI